MIMKSAKNANYIQIDHSANILKSKGVELMRISEALNKYEWLKKYLYGKPKEGYFIFVKKQIKYPLITCVTINSKKIKQEIQNIVIIDKNLKISINGTCGSLKKGLDGVHYARGMIILKEGAHLKYNHLHSWNDGDEVNSDYEFYLEKNSRLDYNYNTVSSPKNLSLITKVVCLKKSAANLKISGICKNSKMKIKENLILKENNSSGILKLRFVGKENSKILSHSSITAEAESKGHLDCQGLLIDKTSKISLIPELVCKDNRSQITHEASIGKISEEELHYLRTRGLNEQEAIDLIVNGFLEM